MNDAGKTWLPTSAAAHDVIQARVSKAIADWSGDWLLHRPVRASSFIATKDGERSDGLTWEPYGSAVGVAMPRRAIDRLLGWILGAEIDRSAGTDADQRLLSSLTQRFLSDLAAKIEDTLQVRSTPTSRTEVHPSPLGRLGGLIVGLSDDRSDDLGSIAIPLEAFVETCITPRGASRGQGLDPMKQGLNPIPMTITASLGRSRISVAQLSDLSPGDVVVLDTLLDKGAALNLSGRAFARADVARNQGELTLTVTSRV